MKDWSITHKIIALTVALIVVGLLLHYISEISPGADHGVVPARFR